MVIPSFSALSEAFAARLPHAAFSDTAKTPQPPATPTMGDWRELRTAISNRASSWGLWGAILGTVASFTTMTVFSPDIVSPGIDRSFAALIGCIGGGWAGEAAAALSFAPSLVRGVRAYVSNHLPHKS